MQCFLMFNLCLFGLCLKLDFFIELVNNKDKIAETSSFRYMIVDTHGFCPEAL